MRRGVRREHGWRTRGQSNVIAVVLLAGLVLAGATVVVVAGTTAIDQARGKSSVTAAEQSMQSLKAAIEESSRESSSQSSVDFAATAGQTELVGRSSGDPARAGRVTVTVDPPSGSTETETIWLGTVRYERDGQTVAYQGGGIWRKTDGGSTVVSAPPVSFRSKNGPNTLTMQFVNISGAATGSDFSVGNVSRRSLSSLGLGSYVKPGTSISIEIRSEFYQAWGEALASELGPSVVTVDEADQRVTVTVSSPRPSTAPSAVLGTDPLGELTISNYGATDSYDSAAGPYPGYPNGLEADIKTEGEIKPTNKMSVRGNVIAENGIGVSNDQIPNKLKIEGRMILGDDPDLGRGDYLKVSAKSKHYPGPTFEGLFSTQDSLKIIAGTHFGDDVLVAGKFKVTGNNRPEIDGNLVVEGSIRKIGEADIGGDIYVDGPVEQIATRDTVDIGGSLYVNGDVDLESGTEVDGQIYYPASHSTSVPTSLVPKLRPKSQSWIDNQLAHDSPPPQEPIVPDVPSRPSASSEIDSMASEITSTNDNDDEPVIDDHKLDFTVSDTTLESGRYHLERLNVPDGDTLTLDTTGGDVAIYVEDHPNTALRVAGTLEVQGDDPANRVRIYVDDTAEDRTREVEITGDGVVSVPDDRSANMWVYLKPTADVDFNTHAVFQGVMYGASSGSGGADIEVNNHAEVFGALLGDVLKIPNHARVHYDTALEDRSAFGGTGDASTVSYVHFGARTVVVDG